MSLEYDPRGDIAYIHVGDDPNPSVDHTERVGDDDEYERGIDYVSRGHIVGYEFMNESRGLNLDLLPHYDEIAAFMASIASLRVI